ncbi:MAG: T9SS type A sorting domain-containing protein [Dysgonamonadaceae bacterium]|jgi:O-glycosyl hydrolase|nr:T9SS type A sorting domain-containing protein [Dysgonamonadaceae bacterium]
MIKRICIAGCLVVAGTLYIQAQTSSAVVEINIDPAQTYQTIESFAASDCWTGNYVGNYWNETPKNTIAKYLFSQNFKTDGSPEGVGLSMWRFNLGAGTLEQGDAGGIEDISRRAECFLDDEGNYDWSKQAGQQWFLQKAKEYGCDNFVAFSNSPLVRYTRNGKGYANGDGNANLQADKYDDFAGYMTEVLKHFKEEGIDFRYISPVNEPQWDWKDPSQEGSPWQNEEIKQLVVELDKSLQEKGLNTQILLSEAGQWDRLYQTNGRASNQIYQLFDRRSSNYIGDLPSVAPVVGGHSYWTHDTNSRLRSVRQDVKTNAKKYDLAVFQTEWSMLSGGEGLSNIEEASYMDIALFMAKIIHCDLVYAEATSWSYWTSMDMERWNHKNRFLLIALNPGSPPNAYTPVTQSGTVIDRSTLWALGNYSFFVRPGYKRIQIDGANNLNEWMGTAYLAPDTSRIVAVYINMATQAQKIKTQFSNLPDYEPVTNKVYVTSSSYNLKKYGSASSETYSEDRELTVPARSVTTVVYELKKKEGLGISYPETSAFRIYPNPLPAGGTFRVDLPETVRGKVVLSLYSLQGNLIYSENKSVKETKTVTLPFYIQKGIYILKTQSGKNTYQTKLSLI